MTHPAPNSELTSESVKLLKAGDVLRRIDGRVFLHRLAHEGGLSGRYLDGSTHANSPASHFTFIGRPDADGWIPHDGGPNPVPGCVVEWKDRDGYACTERLSDALRWSDLNDPADIIAFRLAAPSVERKPLTPIDYLVEALSPPKPDVAGARERLFVAAYTGNADHVSVRKSDLRDQLETTDRQGEENERLRGDIAALLAAVVCVEGEGGRRSYALRVSFGMAYQAARARQGGPDHG